jgi:anti-anti-sigma regulatory factor
MSALALPADLIRGRLEACAEALLTCLEQGGPVDLDGSAVQAVDAAGLQLLVAAATAARGRGLGLQLAAASGALLEALGTAGLLHLFGGEE